MTFGPFRKTCLHMRADQFDVVSEAVTTVSRRQPGTSHVCRAFAEGVSFGPHALSSRVSVSTVCSTCKRVPVRRVIALRKAQALPEAGLRVGLYRPVVERF